MSILPAAHAAGCRTLAMEALSHPGDAPTTFTSAAPPERVGYLEQPEMWELVEAALALDWTLVAYECPTGLAPEDVLGPDEDRQYHGIAFANWRERQQARNLLAALADHKRMLVWCGNGHHGKHVGDDWTPMGSIFAASAPAFCIDQIPTVSLAAEHAPVYPLTAELVEILEGFGGTAGFLVEETPSGFRPLRGFDAAILSTDNAVT